MYVIIIIEQMMHAHVHVHIFPSKINMKETVTSVQHIAVHTKFRGSHNFYHVVSKRHQTVPMKRGRHQPVCVVQYFELSEFALASILSNQSLYYSVLLSY